MDSSTLPRLVLAGGRRSDGTPWEVAADPQSGRVVESGPRVARREGDWVEDCTGMLLLPGVAEPHAHLDKALAGPNSPAEDACRGRDLSQAIAAWSEEAAGRDEQDYARRARRALSLLSANGVTLVRAQVGVGAAGGFEALEGVCEAAAAWRKSGLGEVQVVAMMAALDPQRPAQLCSLAREARDRGAALLGGCPYREERPEASTAVVLDVAAELGMGVDLHTDETTDPQVLSVQDLARLAKGHPGLVSASHCVSLGVQPADVAARIAAELAEAEVSVITLPLTNLYLQGRQEVTLKPRGLSALRSLLSAGVVVGAGADNLRDPSCPIGRLDPLETASLLVLAGHLSPLEAFQACSLGARSALGADPPTLEAGSPAEILVVEGSTLAEALSGPPRRMSIHAGRVVARSQSTSSF